MKPSQNSLFKAATYVRAVAENGTLELVPQLLHEPVLKFKLGLVAPFGKLRKNDFGPFVMSLSNHKAPEQFNFGMAS